MDFKFVCPKCLREETCELLVKIVNERRTPYWKCSCGWEGETRTLIPVTGTPLTKYSRADRPRTAPTRALQPQTIPKVEVFQIREPGPGVCPECREIISTLLEAEDGYSCPECGSVLFLYEEEDRAKRFLEECKPPQPQPMNCPYCDQPLVLLYGTDAYIIEFKDGHWTKQEEESRIVCGDCYEELNHTDIEDIMRAVGLL